MGQKTRAALKLLFETGDKPTESQFGDLIDSQENITDDGVLVGGENNITAFNGGGLGGAYQLTKKENRVGTSVNANDSVKLPTGVPGMESSVFNDTANVIDVYAALGGQIMEGGVDNPTQVASVTVGTFKCYAADKWSTPT